MTLILSGTNGLSDVDGDASTPAVRGTDANSGIFFGADTVGVSTGGSEKVSVGASAVVVNDGGADVDFRVEGDTNANLLFVDASADAPTAVLVETEPAPCPTVTPLTVVSAVCVSPPGEVMPVVPLRIKVICYPL